MSETPCYTNSAGVFTKSNVHYTLFKIWFNLNLNNLFAHSAAIDVPLNGRRHPLKQQDCSWRECSPCAEFIILS